MELRQKKRLAWGIPTASMGDIAFLIIIFFMTSTVFTREKGIKMLLPEKTETEIKVKPENVVSILINPEGALKLKAGDYEAMVSPGDYSEVRRVVEEKLLERDTLLVVSLRASRDAPYKAMISVLDQIKLCRVIAQDGRRELRANKISLVPTSEE